MSIGSIILSKSLEILHSRARYIQRLREFQFETRNLNIPDEVYEDELYHFFKHGSLSIRWPRQSFYALSSVVPYGDSGVGKSCLIRCLFNEDFCTALITTIGHDVRRSAELEVWDIPGQERFTGVSKVFIHQKRVVHCLVVDGSEFRGDPDADLAMNVSRPIERFDMKPDLIVVSKMDIAEPGLDRGRLMEMVDVPVIFASSKTGEGMDDIRFEVSMIASVKRAMMAEKRIQTLMPDHSVRSSVCLCFRSSPHR
jgi:signal recognition particle receptor subunit beta